MFTLSDFDFHLPPELIAQTALPDRTASRLLEVDNAVEPPRLTDRRFAELPSCIAPGDLLVLNDTKVLKARFFGHKASGGKIEVLIEDSVAQINGGSELVERAGEAMRVVSASISRVVQTMAEITSASVEQSTGIEQVNQAVTQMDQLTQQNAALVEQVAAAAASLNDQTAQLMRAVSVFELGDARAAARDMRAGSAFDAAYSPAAGSAA